MESKELHSISLELGKKLIEKNPELREWVESKLPELKESEDERIRKAIITYLKSVIDNKEYRDKIIESWIAWLEKQGEQKKELLQELNNKLNNALENETPELVEPKFKVGDWVVYDHRAYQVVELPKEGYINLGLRRNGKIEFAPSPYCRLWTIQDAKDGDVLINWNNTIFIFKAIEDETVKFHIAYNEKWDATKVPSTKLSHLGLPEPQFEFHPATKEQRDTLIKAMADAGYTFDFEKKELKKIEQKPVEWSEEDEQYLLVCKNALTKYQVSDKWDANIISQWLENKLKFLKPQPKQEWSEEDEKMLNDILMCGEHHCYLDAGNIAWLKFLKDRYCWKPSEEQIKALENVSKSYLTYTPDKVELESLYNELKQL